MNANQIQKHLLILFWNDFGGWKAKHDARPFDRGFKMNRLKAMANMVIKYKKQKPRKARREEFDKFKHKICRPKPGDPCFVCSAKGFHRHHIIQLNNGGINSRRNLVIVCSECHAEIHPWMK